MKKLIPIKVIKENGEVVTIDTSKIVDFTISHEEIIIFFKDKTKVIFNRDDYYYIHWRGLIEDLERRFE